MNGFALMIKIYYRIKRKFLRLYKDASMYLIISVVL
jgi:hypothetical protein